MAWTTPKTWTVDEVVGASDMNTHLRDNLNALKDPPTAVIVRDNNGQYSTTSTSFVAVDDTNLKCTLTTAGGNVEVWFNGVILADSTTSRHAFFDIQVDGDGGWAQDKGFAEGIVRAAVQTTVAQPVAFGPIVVEGLEAGEHTFALLWKQSGGTLYLNASANKQPAILIARER